MKILHATVAGAAVAAVALTASMGSASARPTPSTSTTTAVGSAAGVSAPGWQAEVRVGTPLTVPTEVPADTASAGKLPSARFSVTYSGFTAPARAAFQRAVDIWARKLNSPVPVTVRASFEPLGAGVLGSAGPSSVWRNFPGAPKQNTWYVDAVANKRRGSQLASSPDIVARFSSNFANWHYGTGPAPAGTYDFTSVVLHELGHGVGFLGAGTVSGGQGSVTTQGFPIAYDLATENAAGRKLTSFASPSAALRTQLTSNRIVIDTPRIRSTNGGRPAKLYAPRQWQQGSSYSHFDEATFRAGNPNSLMTPQIGAGETIRNPSPLTMAVLTAVGW